jgi:hypothetical protein
MQTIITLKQGEARTLTFTITQAGAPVVLTGAAFLLGVKKTKADAECLFSKEDAAFDKSQAAQGVVAVPLLATDTNQEPGSYYLELKTTLADESIDKSDDIALVIQKAVTA